MMSTTQVYTYTHTHVHTHTDTHTRMYTHTHTDTRPQINTHMYTRPTFLIVRHLHRTRTCLVHLSGQLQGPSWQSSTHRWPHAIRFGHRPPHCLRRHCSGSGSAVHSWQAIAIGFARQWQWSCRGAVHGGHSPLWHTPRGHACVQPAGRGLLHGLVQGPQPLSTISSDAPALERSAAAAACVTVAASPNRVRSS